MNGDKKSVLPFQT